LRTTIPLKQLMKTGIREMTEDVKEMIELKEMTELKEMIEATGTETTQAGMI